MMNYDFGKINAQISDTIARTNEGFYTLAAHRAQVEGIQIDANTITINSTSDHAIKHLSDVIRQFESDLDPAYEIALRLVSFGQSIIISVTDIWDLWPNLIRFDGYANGDPVSLIQNVSQLSFLLLPQKRLTEEPRKPIGFHVHDDDE